MWVLETEPRASGIIAELSLQPHLSFGVGPRAPHMLGKSAALNSAQAGLELRTLLLKPSVPLDRLSPNSSDSTIPFEFYFSSGFIHLHPCLSFTLPFHPFEFCSLLLCPPPLPLVPSGSLRTSLEYP